MQCKITYPNNLLGYEDYPPSLSFQVMPFTYDLVIAHN